MKKFYQRMASLALSLVLAASLCVLPASAATTSFSDVSDPDTAAAIESLRLMGVLGGFQDGTFRPYDSLTRSQFSKMVVYAQDGASQLGLYSTYTIFPDVRPSHWAAGYINMASRGLKTINGFADGKFYPDNTVTGGQAVTILMRLLGYTDADVGAVWPDGYLSMAATIGLTDNVEVTPYGNLSRGQAAELFANLFLCNKKEGGNYASSVAASVVDDVVLLSSNATAPDGSTGAMQLGNGTTYKMAATPSNGMLNGRQGTLLLNKDGKVMTFIPSQEGASKVVSVGEATALAITDASGTKYALKADTKVFRNGEETTWGDVFAWVNPGTSVTLYLGASGNVDHVFVGTATSAEDAIIVPSNGSSAGFDSLAHTTNYTIYKNGLPATRADMREFDVAIYDSATNAIRVSDSRLTGYYEACYPTPSAPSTITVMGKKFDVLPSAVESLSKLKMNQSITLLLTEDLQVAGAVEAVGTTARGNMLGIATSVSAGSATVKLFNGMEVTGSNSYTDKQAQALDGQVVKVSSGGSGKLSLSRLTGSSSHNLDLGKETLGTAKLAANVKIYETIAGGALRPITLDEIHGTVVNSAKIAYAGKDWRGDVNILILNDVTGNNYVYGLASVATTTTPIYTTDDNGTPSNPDDDKVVQTGTSTSHTLTVQNGDTTVGPLKRPSESYSGQFIGIALSVNGEQIAGVKSLDKLKDVSNTAWRDETTVTTGGKTYTVSKDVQVYDRDSRSWSLSLAAAHAYAAEADLYVDNFNVVRIVVIG